MKSWLSAMRLRTLPLALASIAMAGFLAASVKAFEPVVFFLALLTAAGLQVLSNLANDYGDSIHGADGDHRIGPVRQIQVGAISKVQMVKAMWICTLITLSLGLALIMYSNINLSSLMIFLALGIVALGAAVLYTNGSKPYGYMGLGDLAVFVFFGLLGVLGTYYLMTQKFEWMLLLPASALGFFTVAVLNVNNIRDLESDKLAGKNSIPVRLGRAKAVWYHWFLLLGGIFCMIVFIRINYAGIKPWMFMLASPLLLINAFAVKNKKEAGELDPYLKQMAISTLCFVLFFGIGILL